MGSSYKFTDVEDATGALIITASYNPGPDWDSWRSSRLLPLGVMLDDVRIGSVDAEREGTPKVVLFAKSGRLVITDEPFYLKSADEKKSWSKSKAIEIEDGKVTEISVHCKHSAVRGKVRIRISEVSVSAFKRKKFLAPRNSGSDDDDGPTYWATGNYDPQRYYSATRGMSREEREYIRDAYGDLDTWESNRPD